MKTQKYLSLALLTSLVASGFSEARVVHERTTTEKIEDGCAAAAGATQIAYEKSKQTVKNAAHQVKDVAKEKIADAKIAAEYARAEYAESKVTGLNTKVATLTKENHDLKRQLAATKNELSVVRVASSKPVTVVAYKE